MTRFDPFQPVDYLIIGHITQDLTPEGPMLGGTASYAALTARALGLKVGLVTAFPAEIPLTELTGVSIARHPAEFATTFENIQTPAGRIQFIHHRAPTLTAEMVPEAWRSAPVVHLGPVANEVDPELPLAFPNALIGFTPQGWLRDWDDDGRVSFRFWPEAQHIIRSAGATVLSIEDLCYDEQKIDELIQETRLLVVTEGHQGARLFWNGDVRRFRPCQMEEVDPTGAGDIFATAFFYRLSTTNDPWEAARFATLLASQAVTRLGLHGVPTREEVVWATIEILSKS